MWTASFLHSAARWHTLYLGLHLISQLVRFILYCEMFLQDLEIMFGAASKNWQAVLSLSSDRQMLFRWQSRPPASQFIVVELLQLLCNENFHQVGHVSAARSSVALRSRASTAPAPQTPVRRTWLSVTRSSPLWGQGQVQAASHVPPRGYCESWFGFWSSLCSFLPWLNSWCVSILNLFRS